jgi:hypothetical protein
MSYLEKMTGAGAPTDTSMSAAAGTRLMGHFGGGFEQAEEEYNQMLSNVQAYINQMYGAGRGDIQAGLERAYGYEQPYTEAGKTAVGAYLASLGLGPTGGRGQQDVYQKFVTGPGYTFALRQGTLAAQRQTAARGMTGTGAEQREVQRLGQGMAEQQWSQYQNRLAQLAGMGETAAGASAQMAYGGGQELAQLGTQYAGMDVQAQEMAAKARAEAEMAKEVQKEREEEERGSTIGKIIGGIGGAAAGFVFGGPPGAIAGGAEGFLGAGGAPGGGIGAGEESPYDEEGGYMGYGASPWDRYGYTGNPWARYGYYLNPWNRYGQGR